MVAPSGAPSGPDRLRPLSQPQALPVQEDYSGKPVAVFWQGQRVPVEGIRDIWRIDDEWWRKEISRLYYQVVLRSGRLLILFRDLLNGQWFMQPAAIPRHSGKALDVFVRQPAASPAAVSQPEQSSAAVGRTRAAS